MSTSSTSATIAILAGTTSLVSSSSTIIEHNNGIATTNHVNENRRNLLTVGDDECNTFDKTATHGQDVWIIPSVSSNEEEKEDKVHHDDEVADAGILLVGCNDVDQTCVPDESSSLGGRCTTTTDVNTNRHSAVFINSYNGASSTDRRSSSTIEFGRDIQPSSSASLHLRSRSRSLQSYTFNCPTTCSQSFCNCIQSTFDGIDFLQDKSCASEIANVCTTTETLAACGITEGTNYYIGFITEGICPYAECLVKVQEGDKMEEECFCEYYR